MVSKMSPAILVSNQVPESQAVRLVSKAPQTPPTCFSVKMQPQSSPIPMKIIEQGSSTAMAAKTFTVKSRPKAIAARKQTMVWQTAIGSSGSMYPVIKFPEVIGYVKSLSMKELV